MNDAHPTAEVPRTVCVGIDLVPSHGGPCKTVGAFQRALGAEVVSFTHPDNLAEAQGAYRHVRTIGGRFGRQFLYAPPSEIARLEPLAAQAGLLSCHILYRHSAHWVWRQARRRKLPFWIVPHGCLDPFVFTYRAGIKRLWMSWLGRRMLASAAHVIFSSQRELEKARPWLSRDNGRVVHWPVDVPEALDIASSRAQCRARLGLPASARLLLFLGRLHSMKRPHETLENFAVRRPPDWHLVFVGPDGDVTAEQLQRTAAAADLAGRVHCVGPAYGADKLRWQAGADAFVSFSVRENFNHAAAEAMAAGLPVLLSAGNDLGPELAARECGVILREDSPHSFQEALATLEATPAAGLQQWGRNGQAFVRSELSFARFRENVRLLAREAVQPVARC